MADIDLSKYELVDTRIARFYEEHPDGRIITNDLTSEDDRQHSMWRIIAIVYFDRQDQQDNLPKATGYASEIDGVGMTQKHAALETCETSAIGRALANAGYSPKSPDGGSARPTREEMGKAARQGAETKAGRPRPKAVIPFTPPQLEEALGYALGAVTIEEGREHYKRLSAHGCPPEQLDQLAQKYAALPAAADGVVIEIPKIITPSDYVAPAKMIAPGEA